MTSRGRALSFGTLALLLGVALLVWRPTSSAVLYSGFAQADTGPLSLEVTVTPPVGLPGATMQLNTRITNHGDVPLTPSILVQLPHGVAADMYAMPAGATFNLQTNHIDWLPVVPARGVQEFAIDMTVQTIDVMSPEQAVVAVIRHQGDEKEVSAPLWIGITPLVGEVLAQSQVAVGQPIRLQADIAGPGPITMVWDMGDGRRLELPSPEIVFPTAGRHEIIVEATNPGGRITRRYSVMVLPNPVAAFQPDDGDPAVDQPVSFRNTSGGQPPLTVFWDFGDGSTVMGEQQPNHVYEQPGTYRVRLSVENEFGRSEAVQDITVGVAPVADMALPDTTAVGERLTAQAFGDNSVTRFQWDMGDGQTHEGATITHSYRLPGDYYVTMTADNGYEGAQMGRWIRVNPGITSLFLPLAAHLGGDLSTALSADMPVPTELDPAVDTLAEKFTLEPIQFQPGTAAAEQLLAYINAARARFALPPMPYGYELSAAAQTHALDKARFPENPHVGTDGTTAAERLLRSGYRGGYLGEATAWGFPDPRLAVEFWINSDNHRPLLLNTLGTDVGVGYVEDMSSANVWHWTAEFGLPFGSPVRPVLRSLLPAVGYSALESDVTNYNWMWPVPLAAGERFTVYLIDGNDLISIGSIAQPVFGSRYVLSVDALGAIEPPAAGIANPIALEWLVRLEDGRGGIIAESERRPMALTADPAIATPTPVPTVVIVTATLPAPTPTSTPTSQPTAEPPSNELPPVLITATPVPSP